MKHIERIGFGMVLTLWSNSPAQAGDNFVLIANEKNTRDMSVNLGVNALRGPTVFANHEIKPPISLLDRTELSGLFNHDTGVLDVQHTLNIPAPLSSRILLQFQTLKDQLAANCWTADQASNLRATLRLYVIPPYGPTKHNRLLGISPTVHLPPEVGLNPPPASVPIGVFRQVEPWVEGSGQNDFFTATYGPEYLLDVKRVGVAGPNTVWLGQKVEPVDVCLNRQPGLQAIGDEGQRAILCFDDDPNWQPWVEWDVTAAVRLWIEQGFDPVHYHGFSLYQYPGETAEDQIRISPETAGQGRSRPVISFASSSAEADCPAAGGEWGGRGNLDLVYGNQICMSTVDNDLEPGAPFESPRFITPVHRPEWAPQLVIEAITPDAGCNLAASIPTDLDTQLGATLESEVVLRVSSPSTVSIDSTSFTGAPFEIGEIICSACPLHSGDNYVVPFRFDASSLGEFVGTLVVGFHLPGEEVNLRSLDVPVTITVSEDCDGISDAVENLAAANGDGNGDGVFDRAQGHVASFRTLSGEISTIVADVGVCVKNAHQPILTPNETMQNLDFPFGFIGFELREVREGATAPVTITFPEKKASAFYGFGRRNSDSPAEWYPFGFDSSTASAHFDGNRATLLLTDGASGDHDLLNNGVIVFTGGAAVPRFDDGAVGLTDATIGAVRAWILVVILVAIGIGLCLANSYCDG